MLWYRFRDCDFSGETVDIATLAVLGEHGQAVMVFGSHNPVRILEDHLAGGFVIDLCLAAPIILLEHNVVADALAFPFWIQ